jgi:hypothetical protein
MERRAEVRCAVSRSCASPRQRTNLSDSKSVWMYHLGWLRYQCFIASTDPKECIPAMMALGDDSNETGLN